MRRLSTRPAALLAVVSLVCYSLHMVVASSRSVESAYDTNKGVFSPQGRLVQLDYVEGIVKRSNLCMGAECKDGVVLVTNKLMSADAAKQVVDGGARRIYRVDQHIGILPAGLPADGRALAQKAMEYCRIHRREYGEPIPGKVLADRMGEFMHAACVRWGSRAYPNALFVACWEDGDGDDGGGEEEDLFGSPSNRASLRSEPPGAAAEEAARVAVAEAEEEDPGEQREDSEVSSEGVVVAAECGAGGAGGGGAAAGVEAFAIGGPGDRAAGFRLYVVDPSGAARRHRAACTGRGSARARRWLRRRCGFAEGAESGEPVAAAGGDDYDDDDDSDDSDADDAVRDEGDDGGGDDGDRRSRPSSSAGFSGRVNGDDDSSAPAATASEATTAEDGQDDEKDDVVRGEGGGDRKRAGDRRDGDKPPRVTEQRRRPRRRQRLPWLPLSQMTCAEAAQALVREAERVGGDAGRDFASSAEVAWVSSARATGVGRTREGKPTFVHHRTVGEVFDGQ